MKYMMPIVASAVILCTVHAYSSNEAKYNASYVQELTAAAKRSVSGVKQAFFAKRIPGGFESMRFIAKWRYDYTDTEINQLSRYEVLNDADDTKVQILFDELHGQNKKVNEILLAVDKHQTIEDLIESQNNRYPVNLNVEQALSCILETTHYRKQHGKHV